MYRCGSVHLYISLRIRRRMTSACTLHMKGKRELGSLALLGNEYLYLSQYTGATGSHAVASSEDRRGSLYALWTADKNSATAPQSRSKVRANDDNKAYCLKMRSLTASHMIWIKKDELNRLHNTTLVAPSLSPNAKIRQLIFLFLSSLIWLSSESIGFSFVSSTLLSLFGSKAFGKVYTV